MKRIKRTELDPVFIEKYVSEVQKEVAYHHHPLQNRQRRWKAQSPLRTFAVHCESANVGTGTFLAA